MPKTLIGYALARLSDFPQATFSETELREYDDGAFLDARDRRLFRYVQTYVETAAFPCSSPHCEGGSRSVTEIGGELWALCNCPALEAARRIDKRDLSTWRLDIDALCSAYQARNGLNGEAEALNDHLVYLGRTTKGGISLVIVLGLFSLDQVRLQLAPIPHLVTDSHDRLVLLCPGFRPTQKLIREFEPQRITLAGIDDDQPLLVDPRTFRSARGAAIGEALTEAEQEEMDRYGLLTSVRVQIGVSVSRNVVMVNGLDVRLTPVPFRQFLRLMVARVEVEDGLVSAGRMMKGGGLADEGYYKPESINQSWSKLRSFFGTALGETQPNDFLQVRYGKGRISTLKNRVTWDAEALAGHTDRKVQELGRRLLAAGS